VSPARAARARVIAATVIAALVGASDTDAPRPPIPAGSDVNDPESYLAVGDGAIDANPEIAANAFHWAARLDPTNALAYYGQRTAQLTANGRLLQAYMEGRGRALRSPERRAIDSLYLRAVQLDPLLYPRYARTVYDSWVERRARTNSQMVARMIFTRAGPMMSARYAAALGEVETAINHYAKALEAGGDTALIRFERGMVYATLSPLFEVAGIVDSALADLEAVSVAIAARQSDSTADATYYFSTALHEHRIAALLALRGDRAAAREAYGRVMAEDLSYFPAHLATAALAIEMSDTLTALSAIALAADAAPNEPVVQLRRGELFAVTEQYAESAEAMRKVIALEPYFALPHYRLADVLEILGDEAGALEEYRRFVTLGRMRDPLRGVAEERIAVLSARQPAAQGSSARTRSK
jgi:tetratricopeptide (TPR) repeat protein